MIFTLALFCISIFTTSVCPFLVACISARLPLLTLFTSAPVCISSFMILGFPAIDVYIKGVPPILIFSKFTSAPLSIKSFTISALQSLTASINGVERKRSIVSTLAPSSSRISALTKSQLVTALINFLFSSNKGGMKMRHKISRIVTATKPVIMKDILISMFMIYPLKIFLHNSCLIRWFSQFFLNKIYI